MQSANFASLLEPKLRKVFFLEYDEIPEQYPKVFKTDTSKKAVETDQHVTGVGMPPLFDGTVTYDDMVEGDDVTYTHDEYARGIQVERKLVDDDLHRVIEKRPKALARAFRARVETTAADILNNGFSNTGYDAVSLFSNSHPLRKSGGTHDNLAAASALSDSTLKTMLIQMRDQVDDAGIKIQAIGNNLIVPTDLEYTALEITQSDKKSGVADNDANTLRGRITVTVLDYLTSTTAHILQDKSLHEMWFFWRVKPEFKSEENFDTLVAKYRGYMRYSCGLAAA